MLPILPERVPLQAEEGPDRARSARSSGCSRATTSTRSINACDAGREGELIFREIVEHLGSQQAGPPAVAAVDDRRGDPRAASRACARGAELQGLADAAACRAQSDWLIGMNATRALTKRLKSRKEKTAWSAGPRADADARDAGRQGDRGAGARAAPVLARHRALRARRPGATRAAWFDPRFDAGDDTERKDDRIFDEARAAAIAAAATGRPGARRGDAQAVARVGAAALRPDQPAARGQPALRLVGAAHALRRAALLRAPQAAHLSAHRFALPARPTTAQRWPRTLDAFAENRRRDEDGFADYAAAAAHLRAPGSRTRRASSTTPASPITSRSCRPARCRATPLTGDDKRLFDLVARRFLGAFHPPALWERVERTHGRRASSFRTRARTLVEPGWRRVLPDTATRRTRRRCRRWCRAPSEASGVAVRALEAQQSRRRRPSRRRASPRRACSR